MNIDTIQAKQYLSKLTSDKLNANQLNRAIAYLRGHKIVFYDNFKKNHVFITCDIKNAKIQMKIIEALREALKIRN